MAYAGKAVRKGDSRTDVVSAVQARLNAVGCGPVATDGVFGEETESAVRMFQARRNLDADGVIGLLTWNELFSEETPVDSVANGPLLERALQIALGEDGVREEGGENRGRRVEAYLARVGLDGGNPWCQAFVYWCFDEAARALNSVNPLFKTGRVLESWIKSPIEARIAARAASDDPRLIRPGAIFVIDFGHDKGHAGIVTKVLAGEIATIEGNTNPLGSRDGYCVFQHTRPVTAINVGFLDYGLLDKQQ